MLGFPPSIDQTTDVSGRGISGRATEIVSFSSSLRKHSLSIIGVMSSVFFHLLSQRRENAVEHGT